MTAPPPRSSRLCSRPCRSGRSARQGRFQPRHGLAWGPDPSRPALAADSPRTHGSLTARSALHTIVGLAASTGLRISELVRLDKADVDLATGVLLIRQTKFRKDRYVPTHPSTLETLRRYAALHDASFPDCRDAAFFVTLRQRRFARNTLQQAVCKIARRAGLRGPSGAAISFHSLRHRFAVKGLIAWYESGVDVQAMLPMLATYMGHVCHSDTAYYLTATPELLGLAAKRCQAGDRP